MAIIIPKRGYLTFAELRQRWQCTDNDLRYLVANGELRPSIKAAGGLTVYRWKTSHVDGCEHIHIEMGERAVPHWWLFLQPPRQTGAMTCKFIFAAGASAPNLGEGVCEGVGEWSWFLLPEAITMSDIEKEAAFFTMDEVLRYEVAHDQDAPPKLEEKPLATRERNTLHRIIGALLELVKNPRDGRGDDAAVIRELVENYSDKEGISKRKLEEVFPLAKRLLSAD